ncbi:MAG: 23S rRNA (uracil(1939)-C(5))-methyltransferase RlmD [Candidatus Aureabacteria bacterium]|nr:23S rRNA (uracil(1939)-C(5))-methyltransferase RlmD [Candidatus Auribacterota bacterium]
MNDLPPICRHFGECGGCRFQDIPYPEQLAAKAARLEEIRASSRLPPVILPPIPSPSLWHYRNKMEFSFAEKDGALICGLHHAARKKEVVDLTECRIFSEDALPILAAVKEFARESGLPAYNPFRASGFWRNLVLREEKNSDRLMVNVITTSRGAPPWDKLLAALNALRTKKAISSLIWTVNDRASDAVIPEKVTVLSGPGYLEETVAGLTFRIHPFSFFQVNVFLLPAFYGHISSSAALAGTENVLDLFCGMGPISLFLARAARRVWGIEREESTVRNARENAAANGSANALFISGETRRVLLARGDEWRGTIDVVVTNPPRSGMGIKTLKRIKEIAPRTIIYSSCRPESFFPEAECFLDEYRAEIIRPFDFFPHTPHVEAVGVFRRKETAGG